MRRSETYHTSSASTYGRRERRAHAEISGSDINSAVYKRAYGQRRPPLIPPNYSGNAFLREGGVEELLDEKEREPEALPNIPALEAQSDQSADNAKNDTDTPVLSGPFGNGLKSEELLLLAMILIVSQGGGNDVLPYLVILLFAR